MFQPIVFSMLVGLLTSFPVVDASVSTNCKVSAWGHWSVCDEASGTRSRTRIVEIPQAGQGTACPVLFQNAGCEPIPCMVSGWSGWSPCEEVGYKIRTRTKVQDPKWGGKVCPPLVERRVCVIENCVMSEWSDWVCDESTGLKRRSRQVLQAPNEEGKPCPKQLDELARCDD